MNRTPLLALLACACLTPSRESQEASAYATSIQPLLYDNGLLAQRVLDAAAAQYNRAIDSDEIGRRWREEIVPLSLHICDQAELVQPAPTWSAAHRKLVDAWCTRAIAYQRIEEAVREGDPERFREGRSLANEAKVTEENWFKTHNLTLIAHGIRLDQYP